MFDEDFCNGVNAETAEEEFDELVEEIPMFAGTMEALGRLTVSEDKVY